MNSQNLLFVTQMRFHEEALLVGCNLKACSKSLSIVQNFFNCSIWQLVALECTSRLQFVSTSTYVVFQMTKCEFHCLIVCLIG
jgi:hypothetical protein